MPIIRWNPMGYSRLFRMPFEDDNEWPEVGLTDGLDIYETADEVVVKAPVPGVSADKVDVTFEDGVLRITAKTEETRDEKESKKIIHRQQRVSSFDYTATLPRAVNADALTAEVSEGVVTVKAPIAQAAKPKKIAVKTKK